MRIPKHVGIIPDGNRRWASQNGMTKDKGYESGIDPGLESYRLCRDLGCEEVTFMDLQLIIQDVHQCRQKLLQKHVLMPQIY